MFNELSKIIKHFTKLIIRKISYHFQDEMFHLSLLDCCTEVIPFEPQGCQKVEGEPHIRQSV